MNPKVTVKICSGTLCYIMGGSELHLLQESLPPQLAERVEIKGSTCMGSCNDDCPPSPPYVEVNGRIVTGVTLPMLIEIIKDELGGR